PYGMQNKDEKDVITYRRSDTLEDVESVKEQCFSRNVVYALGLEDFGNGVSPGTSSSSTCIPSMHFADMQISAPTHFIVKDDHCEAHYQGASHLERGQNYREALRSLPGGAPESHSFDFVPDTSHQDYKMISSPDALWHLFGEDLNVRRTTSRSKSGSGSDSGKSSNRVNGSGNSGNGGTSSGQPRFSRVSFGSLAGVALAGALFVGMA
ncbi:unnamed protein product, partial [Tilletia controversa]